MDWRNLECSEIMMPVEIELMDEKDTHIMCKKSVRHESRDF